MEQSSPKKLWVVVVVLLVLLAGAASAAYYFISSSTDDEPITETNSSSDIPTPLTDVGVVPTSGTWDFIMTATTTTMVGECSSLVGGFQSGGEVTLRLTDDGGVALLDIDGNSIYFNSGYIEGASGYESATYPYATRGGGGTVDYSFVANTIDTIVGTIHWSSQDCSADYPFTMELTQAGAGLSGDAPMLLAGEWNLILPEIDDLACDPAMTGFTNLPSGSVELDYVTNLDTGLEEPGSIYIFNEQGGFSMDIVPNTNVYDQTTDVVDIGNPVDETGDVLLDFEDDSYSAEMSLVATSEITAIGTISIQSSSGCVFTVPFTMTAV